MFEDIFGITVDINTKIEAYLDRIIKVYKVKTFAQEAKATDMDKAMDVAIAELAANLLKEIEDDKKKKAKKEADDGLTKARN